MFVSQRWFELYDLERPEELRWKLDNMKSGFDSYDRAPGAGMEPLRRIAQTLRERRIRSVAFIPPIHEALSRHLLASTNYARYQLWKQELQVIFPELLDFSTGPWTRSENFFKNDPLHFKPQAGVDLINQEILPRVPELGAPANLTP